MQQQTTTSTIRFYDLITQLELRRHQQRMTSIQQNKTIFLMLGEDLEALETKEDICIRPLPEKTYIDNGNIRVTVQVCDSTFQKQVCTALIRRGYVDTDDSTEDIRIMERDNIIFTITPIPQRKNCACVSKAN